MGAVKTHRKQTALTMSNGYEHRLGRMERQDRAYTKDERKWIHEIPGAEEPNNRRKMAGRPLMSALYRSIRERTSFGY